MQLTTSDALISAARIVTRGTAATGSAVVPIDPVIGLFSAQRGGPLMVSGVLIPSYELTLIPIIANADISSLRSGWYDLSMLVLLLSIISMFAAGFGVGYGVREMISRRRRRRPVTLLR